MVRDRQHGPVLELNRISVRRTKGATQETEQEPVMTNEVEPPAAMDAAAAQMEDLGESALPAASSKPSSGKTVFAQMVSMMHLLTRESLLLAHRVWKVKFVGEYKRINVICPKSKRQKALSCFPWEYSSAWENSYFGRISHFLLPYVRR